MKRLAIGEAIVLDVLHTGEHKVSATDVDMKIKKYTGYEVGLFFTRRSNTGEYVS